MCTMSRALREVAAADCKKDTGFLGFGKGNNLVIIIIAILILCGCGTGGNVLGNDVLCVPNGRTRGRRRRRSRRGSDSLIYFLILGLLLAGGGNSGRNTNTNIINVDSEGNYGDDIVDL